MDECCMALNEMEGLSKGVSVRTVQGDIQMMRSDKLGYNAPIEVYEHKYYRYSDPNYRITEMPLSSNDLEVLHEAVDMIGQLGDFRQFSEMADVVNRLRDKVSAAQHGHAPIVHYDRVPKLKGLELLSPLYDHISRRQPLRVMYQSFTARVPQEFILHPYLLKEFRNRWFLFGSRDHDMRLYNLALDRIISAEPAVGVAFRENTEFDVNHFFDDMIGVSKNLRDIPHVVKFWACQEQSHYIKTKPLHSSQELISESSEDGSCVFSIKVVINYEMYSMFMSYGPGVKILSPRRAVNHMRDQLRQAVTLYDNLD